MLRRLFHVRKTPKDFPGKALILFSAAQFLGLWLIVAFALWDIPRLSWKHVLGATLAAVFAWGTVWEWVEPLEGIQYRALRPLVGQWKRISFHGLVSGICAGASGYVAYKISTMLLESFKAGLATGFVTLLLVIVAAPVVTLIAYLVLLGRAGKRSQQ